MSEKRKCSGFPEKPGACENEATAVAMRLPVCEEHARMVEANKGRAVRSEGKNK